MTIKIQTGSKFPISLTRTAGDFGPLDRTWRGLKDLCFSVADHTGRVNKETSAHAIADAVCEALEIPRDAATYDVYRTEALHGACYGQRY